MAFCLLLKRLTKGSRMAISSRYQCIKNVRLADGQIQYFVLCDDNQAFLLRITNDCGVTTVENFELDGVTPYTPVGTITSCASGGTVSGSDVEQRLFCDDNAGVITPYLVVYEYDETGAIVGTTTVELDGVTPYVPTGITRICAGEDGDVEIVQLCDDTTPFLRHIVYDNTGAVLGSSDTELDGSTPYVVTGTIGICPQTVTLDGSIQNAYTDINLVPIAGTNETLIVGAAPVGFVGPFDPSATHVVYTVLAGAPGTPSGAIVAEFDGSVPAVLTSHDLFPGQRGVWSVETAQAAQFIRRQPINGRIHITQMEPRV